MDDEVIEVLEDEKPLEPIEEIELITLTSFTYAIKNGRIIGKLDGKDAMLQAIDKLLRTRRFIFEIYDDQYGHDLDDLIGKDYDYVRSDVERMIQEAILGDDRVDDVSVDSIEQISKTSLLAKVTVATMYGDLLVETEVNA